jgi:hypothetical protein
MHFGKGRFHVESYILRIYRRDEHHPDRIAGIVEDVDNGETAAFRNFSQLVEILSREHSSEIESAALEGL